MKVGSDVSLVFTVEAGKGKRYVVGRGVDRGCVR